MTLRDISPLANNSIDCADYIWSSCCCGPAIVFLLLCLCCVGHRHNTNNRWTLLETLYLLEDQKTMAVAFYFHLLIFVVGLVALVFTNETCEPTTRRPNINLLFWGSEQWIIHPQYRGYLVVWWNSCTQLLKTCASITSPFILTLFTNMNTVERSDSTTVLAL